MLDAALIIAIIVVLGLLITQINIHISEWLVLHGKSKEADKLRKNLKGKTP